MRLPFDDVLNDLGLLAKLAAFDPIVIGTPPLGIDIDTSDIDVACAADDLDEFCACARRAFASKQGFSVRRCSERSKAAVCAVFFSHGWEIELFCQTIPCAEQWGVRHFLMEQRLLRIEPGLKAKIVTLKKDGYGTEPAFARALGLRGDPYEAILALEPRDDVELANLIAAAAAAKPTASAARR